MSFSDHLSSVVCLSVKFSHFHLLLITLMKFKKISPEPLSPFQPNLTQSILRSSLYIKGFKLSYDKFIYRYIDCILQTVLLGSGLEKVLSVKLWKKWQKPSSLSQQVISAKTRRVTRNNKIDLHVRDRVFSSRIIKTHF